MRSIDIHAHLTPQCFIRATQAEQEWHGIRPGSVRIAPRAVWTPEQRIADMNSCRSSLPEQVSITTIEMLRLSRPCIGTAMTKYIR
jgi:hypothetical protein